MVVLLLLVLQLAAPIYYHPETIDHFGYASNDEVQLEGIVGGVDRDDNITSFRLLDEHGHFRRCVLPKDMDPPKAGAHIRVKGLRKFYPATGVAELDPVAVIEPVEEP